MAGFPEVIFSRIWNLTSRRGVLISAESSSILNVNHSPQCGFQVLVDTALESSERRINEHLGAKQWRVLGWQEWTWDCWS